LRIGILAVGRLKAGPERDLCGRYLDRGRQAGRALGFRGFEVLEVAEGRGARPEERKAEEGESLARSLDRTAAAIGLDARGDLVDSAEFAAMLRQALESGRPGATFLIGGPDGLSRRVLEGCARKVALGRVTWPHQLARILVAEQLYRAMTILSGHPYHRA
jgi:23S rRNA (pseudouridine1915-N3)-methyltransferase